MGMVNKPLDIRHTFNYVIQIYIKHACIYFTYALSSIPSVSLCAVRAKRLRDEGLDQPSRAATGVRRGIEGSSPAHSRATNAARELGHHPPQPTPGTLSSSSLVCGSHSLKIQSIPPPFCWRQVTKWDADHIKRKSRAPYCRLAIKWRGEERRIFPDVSCRVDIEGVKQPYHYFSIQLPEKGLYKGP